MPLNYEGSQAIPEPVIFENTVTHQKGIATGSVMGGQPPAVTTPAVPASATAITNTTGYDVMVYVSAGTVTVVAVNGTTTGLTTPASVYLPANGTIAITYTAAPTWVWLAV